MNRIKNWKLRKKYLIDIPITSYLTHGMHSYTAKMIPQLPRYFIENYTCKGETILDPFCGSGTTLLEGRLLSRSAIGIDINPLATLISEVKTRPLDINELTLAISLLKEKIKNTSEGKITIFPNIDYWFCKKAQKELARIKFSIENIKDRFDESIFKFLLVCFSSVIRKSSYADPRMAKTYRSKMVLKKIKEGWKPTPIKYFENALDKNLERMKLFSVSQNVNNNYVKVFHGDARETAATLKCNGIEKLDFIITSPPYINAQDYFRSYKLELWWLDLATPQEVRYLNKRAIGTENILRSESNFLPRSKNQLLNKILKRVWTINKSKSYIILNYFENMDTVFKQIYNVLKRKKYFCLVSGNNTICGKEIPTYKILARLAKDNGFKLLETGRDKIQYRTLFPNRNHKGGFIKEEWITIFQKG